MRRLEPLKPTKAMRHWRAPRHGIYAVVHVLSSVAPGIEEGGRDGKIRATGTWKGSNGRDATTFNGLDRPDNEK